MDKTLLTRYADEGFVNYKQEHLRAVNGKKVVGCYAFIGDEHPELLMYNMDYRLNSPDLIERKQHKKNILKVSTEFPVMIKNRKLPENKAEIYISDNKEFVVIPESPLVEKRTIRGIDFPALTDEYVEVPLYFALRQYQLLLYFYEWLKGEGVGEHATINTSIINYCECIVNIENISKYT